MKKFSDKFYFSLKSSDEKLVAYVSFDFERTQIGDERIDIILLPSEKYNGDVGFVGDELEFSVLSDDPDYSIQYLLKIDSSKRVCSLEIIGFPDNGKDLITERERKGIYVHLKD